LNVVFIDVMPVPHRRRAGPGARVEAEPARGEKGLPPELAVGVGELLGQRRRQPDPPEPPLDVASMPIPDGLDLPAQSAV
jgi:hypothetical protein